MKLRLFTLLSLAMTLVAAFLFVNRATGAPRFTATLDPTFGRGGKVATDIQTPSHQSVSTDIAVQPDGKIVVVGYTSHGRYSRPDFSVMRFNPDGTLDSGFGVGGIVANTFFIHGEAAIALALQTDGKILAGGSVVLPDPDNATAFGIARYNPDGSLDYTFGNEGLATNIVEAGSSIRDIVVQPDGKIVAAGTSGPGDFVRSHFAFSRFNLDGSVDVTFGNQGEVFLDFPGQYDYLRAIALTPEGSIVAGGETDGTGVLARLSPLGLPDPTFGTNGQLVLTGTEDVTGLAVLAGGKILTGSSFEQWPDGYHFAVRRYLSTGALDTSFSGDGLASTLVSGRYAYTSKLLVGSDGKIVLTGAIYADELADAGAVRFDANGNPDPAFGNNGVARANLAPYHDQVWSAAFTPDGGIVTCAGTRSDSGIAKFTSSGALATSFGSGGKVTVRGTLASHNSVRALALQPDGKILALGNVEKNECEDCVRRDVGLIRYNTDGNIDKSFGSTGAVTLDFLDRSWDDAHALVVQPDGKIILGGSFIPFDSYTLQLILVRLQTDGTLDGTFGTGGKVITTLPQGTATLASLTLQPDGKIVAVGTLRKPENTDFLLLRYLPNGVLDNGFGSQGVVLTDFGISYDSATSVALTSNDQIIAAGTTATYTTGVTNTKINFALARYTSAGELDSSFGLSGKTISDYQRQDDTLKAMTFDGEGRILVAGSTGAYSSASQDNVTDFALARYTQDGLLDLSFGIGGWRVTDFGEINESATALVAGNDGKITTVGYTGYRTWAPVYNGTYGGFAFDIAMTRHDGTGTPDETFGAEGKLRMDFGGGESLYSALLDNEHRLVVGGGVQKPLFTDADFLLLRFGVGSTPATTSTSTSTATNTALPITTMLPTSTATHGSTTLPTGTAVATNTRQPSTTVAPNNTAAPAGTSTPTHTPCAVRFNDVPPGEAFYTFIHCLACKGVMGGYSDMTFRPQNNITRAQLAKIVGNASGIVETGGAQRFQDVPNSGGTASFYNQINGLVAAGVMSGYTCGGPGEPCVAPGNLPYFRPSANATRGQIAKIVANAAMHQDPPSGQTFADVAPDSTFYAYVQRLTAMNVMSGYACGSLNPSTGEAEPCDGQNRPYFRPSNNATRGQVSKIVANTFYPNCRTPARK